jgi:hypothetical protein
MSERKLKNNGVTGEVSLDKTKNYKYNKSGALVEATTFDGDDIVFSGSKSSLRRLSDLERNVSILASNLTTTDGAATDAEDGNFDGIFTTPQRFKSATRFDAAVSVNAAVAMNSNKITGLGTPSASTDAGTKGYVDSTVATEATARDTAIASAKSQAISSAATDAASKVAAEATARNTAIATAKAEAISSAATDATTKANAAQSNAASDATTKVATEVTARNTAIASAKAEAISSAATDATNKADTARVLATNAAFNDASMKADQARVLAVSEASNDATTKANAAQAAAIAAVTNGAGAAFDTLKEIQDAMATDAELASAIAAISNVPSATKLQTARTIQGVSFDGTAAITVMSAGAGISVSGTTVTNTITNNNQLANGSGFITGYTETSTFATVTARGATTGSALSTGALTVSGGITATGEITAYYSDINLKKDIVAITDPIAKVMALRGVTYRPNQTALDLGIVDKEEVGVIAQEVEAVLPQLVCPSAFDGYKTVKYEKLTALLLEAVKAQQTQIEALTAQVAKLSAQ